MASPRYSKDKGRRWEGAVRDYLKAQFPSLAEAIERNGNIFGRNDVGDIRGLSDFVVECKDEQKISLSTYMAETEVERVNAGKAFGVAVVKARRKGVEEGYVVMPLWAFVGILKQLGVK